MKNVSYYKIYLLEALFLLLGQRQNSFFSDPDETILIKKLLIYNPATFLEKKGYL